MRSHPFESVVAPLFGELLSEIEDERTERGIKGYDLGDFTTLSSVQRFVDQVAETQSGSSEGSAAMVAEYVQLVYACHAFKCEGSIIISIHREKLLLALKNVGETEPVQSSPCYIQLPRQMFWSQISENAPHEPVDGIFFTPGSVSDTVTLIAVLGFRPDRDGFSQITVSVPRGEFLAARQEGRDPPFGPLMDGGELAGFHSIASPAELLQLTGLALAIEAD